MALSDVLDERLVPFEGSVYLRREGGVLAGRGEAGELVEAPPDAGELAEQGRHGRVVPGPGAGAEGGLAHEASRGLTTAASVGGDLPELVGAEANELGGGPAVEHGPLGITERCDIAPTFTHLRSGRSVLGQGRRHRPSYLQVPRNSAERSGGAGEASPYQSVVPNGPHRADVDADTQPPIGTYSGAVERRGMARVLAGRRSLDWAEGGGP